MSADFHESQRHSKDIDGHFDHVGIIGQTLDLVISQVAGLILDILLVTGTSCFDLTSRVDT